MGEGEIVVSVYCGECRSKISPEDIVCRECYNNLYNEISELSLTIESLNDEIEALTKELNYKHRLLEVILNDPEYQRLKRRIIADEI